ncbi:upstream activation factor subunit spp27 isoform X2 [Selaginella moellendorffii]|nr:upstream activation factor subunit spp27 isoform X2 [Selaginella moellendorffii]|eukprot:XP_024515898.1 upstream activation factor subunit spp27 isoform X2 [Selaginella moellendorffii]
MRKDEDGRAAMPPDAAIAKRVREILASANLSEVSSKDIRKQMEEEMGVSLRSKKAFLREQIESFVAEAEDSGEGEAEEAADAEASGDGDGDSRLRDKLNSAIRESAPSKKTKKKGLTGLQKPCQLSDVLEAIVGIPQAPRSQVVKSLWAYIREHNLQVPEDKRKIKCDEALKKVFNSDYIDMFSMNQKLTKHVIPLDELAYEAGAAKRKIKDEEEDEDGKEGLAERAVDRETRAANRLARKRKAEERAEKKEEARKARKAAGKSPKVSGFTVPMKISPKLREFLGTEESQLSRPEVTKQLWDYIKSNQLQDPSDRRKILCDEKLEKLLDCKSFNGFGGLPKLLQAHLTSTRK